MTNIIISVIIAIIIAVAVYYFGKAVGWQECCKETKDGINLPSPVDTLSRAIKVDRRHLTRYVLMKKDAWHQVNDEIEVLEDEGFTVDEYDAEDGIITMTKAVPEPEPLPTSAKVYIVVENAAGQDVRNIGCFATQEEADAFVRSYHNPNSLVISEEWEIGESVNS